MVASTRWPSITAAADDGILRSRQLPITAAVAIAQTEAVSEAVRRRRAWRQRVGSDRLAVWVRRRQRAPANADAAADAAAGGALRAASQTNFKATAGRGSAARRRVSGGGGGRGGGGGGEERDGTVGHLHAGCGHECCRSRAVRQLPLPQCSPTARSGPQMTRSGLPRCRRQHRPGRRRPPPSQQRFVLWHKALRHRRRPQGRKAADNRAREDSET